MSAPVPVDPAFLSGGVSISLASADACGIATLCRVLGCRFDDGGRVLNLMVDRDQAAQALANIRATGRVAVAFSQPSTHRTVQFKGRDARVVDPTATDLDLCRAHARAFAAEIEPFGWSREYVDALLHVRDAQVLCVRFTPDAAFQQTPGPGAGTRLVEGSA
jgi:hypothetical protein